MSYCASLYFDKFINWVCLLWTEKLNNKYIHISTKSKDGETNILDSNLHNINWVTQHKLDKHYIHPHTYLHLFSFKNEFWLYCWRSKACGRKKSKDSRGLCMGCQWVQQSACKHYLFIYLFISGLEIRLEKEEN